MDVNKGCLPSPEDLKYKILIKAKRTKKVNDKEEKNGNNEDKSDDEQEIFENLPSEKGFKSPFEETMKMARKISAVISRQSSMEKTSDEDNPPNNEDNDDNVTGEENEENTLDEEFEPDGQNTLNTENPTESKKPQRLRL